MPSFRVRTGVSGTAEATSATESPGLIGATSRAGQFIDTSAPSFWAWVYFSLAFGYLLLMYFGYGGHKGAAL